jgi:hypothetical protein
LRFIRFFVIAKPSRIILHMNSGTETWQMWLFAFMQGARQHDKLCRWLYLHSVRKWSNFKAVLGCFDLLG